MLKTIQTYVLKRWTAKTAAGHFLNSNYGSVLKSVKKPLLNQESWAAHLNLFRLIALKETGDESWLSELGELNNQNWLDGYAQDEKNYILIYLLDRLFGEIDITPVINLANVSEATRNTFPIEAESTKFHIYFQQKPVRPNRFNPENYIWLANPKRVRPLIRFSGNLQNLKTFSLSKGPWL